MFKRITREGESSCSLLQSQETKTKYNKKPKLLGLREPDLMIVVTGGKMAYSRPDGVKIIPLACFKD